MPEGIDVALVAVRRPELLARTLESFGARMFAHFPVARVLANIDPVFGGAEEQRVCRELILRRFPQAEIFEPAEAGFCAAVRRVWAATRAEAVFHLEDDWLLNEAVHPEQVLPLLAGDVASVAPVQAAWKRPKLYNVRIRRTRVLGITLRRSKVNIHGTSPRFMTGAFARRCAELMDPALDPEKQMRAPHNPPLRAYIEPLKCRFLTAKDGGPLILDIGRGWREAQGIEKVVADGRSSWSEA